MNASASDRADAVTVTWRVLIVDDEPLARQRLGRLLADGARGRSLPSSLSVEEAGDAEAALAAVTSAAVPFDVLFLDIHLPGVDGIELARRLRAAAPAAVRSPAVVFVTAHAEHALEAFGVAALDYLTKPVRRERLDETLRRLRAYLAAGVTGRGAVAEPAAGDPDVTPGAAAPVVVVHDRGRIVRVPAAEILWLKAELKYVTVRTSTNHWLVDESLSDLEARLGRRFLRIHRNALVAVPALRRLERRPPDDAVPAAGEGGGGGAGDGADGGWAVQVAPTGEWLAVSRRQVPAVRACLSRGEGGAASA